MNVRTVYLRLVLLAVATAATVIGCGAPGSLHSMLPPSSSNITQTGAGDDEEAQLVQRVAESHQAVNGPGAYGVIDGQWVVADPAPGQPGYYVVNGEIVPGPPDDSPPLGEVVPKSTLLDAAAPAATQNCSTFSGDVPPPCTATGPFRRVFSGPGYSFALAHLALPKSKITTMPDNAKLQNGDIGYVYLEGWSTRDPNLGNSEFGFQYSPVNNWYSPYIRTDNPKAFFYFVFNNVPIHYLPSAPVTFAFAGYTIGSKNYMHVAVIGTTDLACTPAGQKTPVHTCLGHDHVQDNDWSAASCCIMARMTTIGQTNPNDAFYDGAKFGPITWSGVELARTAPTPAPGSTILPLSGKEPAWTSAGDQNWPPAQAKIVADNVSDSGETDTIDLAKLPSLTLALSPAADQTVRPDSKIKFKASVWGQTKGLTFDYGWRLYNPLLVPGDSLTVPGATPPPPKGDTFIGPGSAATVNIGDSQGPYSVWLDAYLYFVDAANKVVNYPGGGFLTPSNHIEVGLKK